MAAPWETDEEEVPPWEIEQSSQPWQAAGQSQLEAPSWLTAPQAEVPSVPGGIMSPGMTRAVAEYNPLQEPNLEDVQSQKDYAIASLAQGGIGLQQGFHALGEQGWSAMQAANEPILELGPISFTASGIQSTKGARAKAAGAREIALEARKSAQELQPLAQEIGGSETMRGIGSAIPQLAPVLATGPLGLAAPIAMSGIQQGLGTLSEAQSKFEELPEERGTGLAPNREFWNAAPAAAADAVTTAAITAVSGKLFGAGLEGATAPIKKAAIQRRIASRAKEVLGEVLEEGAQQFVSDYVIGGMSYHPDVTFDEALKNSIEAAKAGGVLGAAVSGVRAATEQGMPDTQLQPGVPREGISAEIKPSTKLADVDSSLTVASPVRENGGRTSVVLSDGTAIVGGRFHGETVQEAIRLGLATEEQLAQGKAAFTRPDGTSWDLQGKKIEVKQVRNLSEASAGVKALGVREEAIPGRTERGTPPPGKTEEGARETPTPAKPAEFIKSESSVDRNAAQDRLAAETDLPALKKMAAEATAEVEQIQKDFSKSPPTEQTMQVYQEAAAKVQFLNEAIQKKTSVKPDMASAQKPGETGTPVGEVPITANPVVGDKTPSQAPGVSYFDPQSETQGLGRLSTRPTVEDVRRSREAGSPPPVEPPAAATGSELPPAPGAKTKESGGVWFAGNNPQETATMMQDRATAFLKGKTDQQAIEELVRLAGGDPNVQLDNQAANFVIKDLLVRASNRAQKTANPVEAVEAWSQVDRLAELSRRLGSEDARSLVSRKLAYRQIDWLMPVMAWRGMVKERWRKALGIPEGQPLNESVITPEEAKKRGLPELNGEATQKIVKLSKQAENLPQGIRRNKVMDEMVKEIQRGVPMSKLDLLRDIWYSSVLMRVGTFVNVLAGSYATGASFTAMAAMDRAVRLHPVQALKIIGQFFGGTFEGAMIADQVARKGAWHLLPDAELRFSNLLSGKAGARYDNLEALLRRGNPIGVLAYTRRFMAALDYIGAEGTRDAQVLYAALTRGDQVSLDALDRRYDRDENKRAGEQARAEMGAEASRAEVLVRKREILEQGVSEELKEAAINTARRAAQNANPRGIPGIIYQAASKLPFWVRAPTGLAFIRAGMNMVQNAMDYIPGLGAITAARGGLGALPDSHPLKRFGMDIPIEERRMMWAAQGASLGIATIAAAMFLGDDDDEGWEISGSWRGIDAKKRSQLMELGERPNSIRFGKKGPWISFKQMPFAPPLAIVGTMRDEERFHKSDWNGESAAGKITAAWLGGLLYVRDLSALSGIAGMFDGNAWNTQEKPSKMTEQLSKWTAQTVGRAASGYIPSIIKEIDEFGDQSLYRPGKDELMGYWIRNIPYARRMVGSGPALNNFGEPIQLTPPPLKSWVGFGKDDELYNTLGLLASKGIFIPEPDRNTKIVVDGNRRARTEDEWYQFMKLRGPLLKSSFTPNDLQWLKTASPEDAVGWLKERTDSARESARMTQKL